MVLLTKGNILIKALRQKKGY